MLQLYSNFAEPHSLWEAQLAILKLSNHDDYELVNQIWENILLKGITLFTFIMLLIFHWCLFLLTFAHF